MRGPVLVDTGPLVAFLNRRDRLHGWARRQLAELEPPLLTCEAVVTETCHLVRNFEGGSEAVMRLITSGALIVPFRLDQELPAVVIPVSGDFLRALGKSIEWSTDDERSYTYAG